MSLVLSGPGIGLMLPQALYPNNLLNGSTQPSTNSFTLAPGETLPIPAGRFFIDLGKYGSLQFLDPVTNIWTELRSGDNNGQALQIVSDGFNVRAANLTGCVVAAVVTNGGNGSYVQATTTVTPSAGNSTWQPIVGGALSTSITVVTSGNNYGIAPEVFIDAPPSPGVQAKAIAVIAASTANGNTVSSITVLDQGAGYPSLPNVTILPTPTDPNFIAGSITANATGLATLTAAGSITAILCTNPGVSVATTTTLTIAGAGASATATPLFLETVTSVTSVSAGAGYAAATLLTTVGGQNSTASPAFTNPEIQLYNYVPRPAMIPLTITGGTLTSVTSIVDGGLFITAPSALTLSSGVVTTAASVTLVLGGANTGCRIQQLA